MNTDRKPKMLLHVCCAPCSPYVVEELRRDYDVTLYFYNPNIHPEEEYLKRLEELKGWVESIGVPLITGDYDDREWFERTKGLENEPERGARCEVCFQLRLSETVARAEGGDFEFCGAVLTVSPHKEAAAINRIGSELTADSRVEFIEADWKKKDGYKKTTKLARELGFYRQNYCGCIFSQVARPRRVG